MCIVQKAKTCVMCVMLYCWRVFLRVSMLYKQQLCACGWHVQACCMDRYDGILLKAVVMFLFVFMFFLRAYMAGVRSVRCWYSFIRRSFCVQLVHLLYIFWKYLLKWKDMYKCVLVHGMNMALNLVHGVVVEYVYMNWRHWYMKMDECQCAPSRLVHSGEDGR